MALQDSDLMLVQRGNQPYRETVDSLSTKIRSDIDVSSPSGDIPIASASQLGVIRVGANLSIDGNGILAAVIPSGLEYKGSWSDANNPPSPVDSGDFYIWTGADGATLNNALWGSINGSTIQEGERLYYDGADWEIVPIGGGGSGLTSVTGTSPINASAIVGGNQDITIDAASGSSAGSMSAAHWTKLEGIESGAEVNVNPTQAYTAATTGGTLTLTPGGDTTNLPLVGTNAGLMAPGDKTKLDGIDAGAEANVNPTQTYSTAASSGTLTLQPGGDTTVLPVATATLAGLMSATDKAQLDSLVSTPGGVSSLTARNGITNNGTSTAPILDVDFGPLPQGNPATAKVMPYDLTALDVLP